MVMAVEAVVNPDATNIWDEAEVYLIAAADVTDIETLVPASVNEELDEQWLEGFIGLMDGDRGIPVTPEMEIIHYDAYGHRRYRSKSKQGTVQTGFTAFEDNSVTKKIVLPGSKSGKVGAPRGLRYYTCYRTVDEGKCKILISSRPALLELTDHSGAVEGEQEAYGFDVHHANDPDGDVFFVVEGELSP